MNGKYGWIDDDDDDLRPERPLRIWMNDMKKRSTEQTKTTYRLRPSNFFSFVFRNFFLLIFSCAVSRLLNILLTLLSSSVNYCIYRCNSSTRFQRFLLVDLVLCLYLLFVFLFFYTFIISPLLLFLSYVSCPSHFLHPHKTNPLHFFLSLFLHYNETQLQFSESDAHVHVSVFLESFWTLSSSASFSLL